MAEPMKKSPEVQAFLDSINPSGRSQAASIRADICSMCGKPATEFTDTISEREYRISGLCQSCQDEVFNGEDE
jgi:hypothetical protein